MRKKSVRLHRQTHTADDESRGNENVADFRPGATRGSMQPHVRT